MIFKKYILLNKLNLTPFLFISKKSKAKNLLVTYKYLNYFIIHHVHYPIIKYNTIISLNNAMRWFNFKKIKVDYHKNFLSYFSVFHLQNYFKSIWNYNFCFRSTNLLTLIKKYYKVVRRQIRRTKMHPKLGFIYPKDIYSLFFCAFMIKDIFLLQTWIKKQFEAKSIKIYKPLIYTIWFLMKTFGWKYRAYNKLKSIFLTFKGKLVKGGSRKKLMEFAKGTLKSSSKRNKFLSTSFVLRTISGSVSCRLYLTY